MKEDPKPLTKKDVDTEAGLCPLCGSGERLFFEQTGNIHCTDCKKENLNKEDCEGINKLKVLSALAWAQKEISQQCRSFRRGHTQDCFHCRNAMSILRVAFGQVKE